MQAMNFSGTYANGTGGGVSYNYAAQPAGSSNSVPSQLIPDSGQTTLWSTNNIVAADAALDWGSFSTFGETGDESAPNSAGGSFTSITELEAFVFSDEDSYESTMKIDDSSQDDGALSSHSSSFNSDMSELYQLSTTLVGQGEVIETQLAGGGSLQNLQDLEAVANVFSWMDVDQYFNLSSEYEAHSLMQPASQIENMNAGSFNVEAAESFVILPSNVPETCSAPAEVSRLSKWQGSVWLVRACHRISSTTAASLRAKVATSAVFKGVMQKRGKWVCEKRIAKKVMLMSKEKFSKVWLGTYKTRDQAARALDVGKFFLCARGSKKSFFDPNSERILSANCSHLLARPLDRKLVGIVKKIAKHYGENNGSLQKLIP